jgi:hypothetical protein
MREKGLIEAEVADCVETIAGEYVELGNHYIRRAELIKKDGIHPEVETALKLNNELKIIHMRMDELQMRHSRLWLELHEDTVCPACGYNHGPNQ